MDTFDSLASPTGAATPRTRRWPRTSWLTPGDLTAAAVCLLVVAFWTARALRDSQPSDMGLAYIAGFVTWHTGHPEVLFSWTGTPLLAAVSALESRVLSEAAATTMLTLLNAVLAIGIVAVVCERLHAVVSRRWLWVIALGLVSFAPLMSTVWWKQINLVAFAPALLGFDLVTGSRRRVILGSALIGFSVALKPLLILLPFFLLVRRETRRAGLLALAWLAGLSMASLGLAAWRAHQLSVLNPWTALSNFAQKSDPHKFAYAYSPDNFSPIATLLRLGGSEQWRLYQAAAIVLVVLLSVWTIESLRGREVNRWIGFAFVAAFSVMVSPISWSHYQLMLAPLLVVLAVGMSREGASLGAWLGLALAFILASLVWRPDGTLTGTVRTLLTQGHLPPDDPGSASAGSMEAISQWAQYVLVATAIIWFGRLARGSGTRQAG